MTAFEKPIHAMDDTLVDLQALIKFALHHAEHAEEAQFTGLRSELVTLLYLMLDKVATCNKTTASLFTIEGRYTKEARH